MSSCKNVLSISFIQIGLADLEIRAAAFDEAYNVVRDKNHLTKETTSTFD